MILDSLKDVHLAYLLDPRAMSSLFYGLASFIVSIFVLMEAVWGTHLSKKWKWTAIFLAAALGFGSAFGFLRFYDSLLDLQYLAAHPDAVTTISQQIRFLDISLVVAASFKIAFLLVGEKAMYKKPPKQATGGFPSA